MKKELVAFIFIPIFIILYIAANIGNVPLASIGIISLTVLALTQVACKS